MMGRDATDVYVGECMDLTASARAYVIAPSLISTDAATNTHINQPAFPQVLLGRWVCVDEPRR